MVEERRAAERSVLPEPIEATLSGTEATIVEISRIGLRVEHDARLTVGANLKLAFRWAGASVVHNVTVIRSEVIGRGAAGLRYASGLRFAEVTPEVEQLVTGLLAWAEHGGPGPDALSMEAPTAAVPEPEPMFTPLPEPEPMFAPLPEPEPEPAVAAVAPRSSSAAPARPVSSFLRPATAPDEDRYMRSTLTPEGWVTERVSVPVQPENGFTILAARSEELLDLQRTYEYADPETRRMIRFAMETQLSRK